MNRRRPLINFGGRRCVLTSRGATLLAAAAWAAPNAVAAQPPGEPWYARDDRGVEAQAFVGAQLLPGAAGEFLGSGVAYGVLVTIEPLPLLGVELGYQGSFYRTASLPGPSGGSDLSVFENGGWTALKGSPRIGRLEPWALAGVGFSGVEVVEEQGIVTELADDTIVLLPIAIGADYHFQDERSRAAGETHLTAGVRAGWTFVFDNDFVPVTARGADRVLLAVVFGAQF